MPRVKTINFYQNRPNIKLFLQKNTKFSDPQNSSKLQISGYVPGGMYQIQNKAVLEAAYRIA